MVTWTSEDLRNYERKRAALNPKDAHKASKLECHFSHGALAKTEAQETNTGRLLIRYTSVRKRLLDEDNISSKWATDCLRYVGAIRGDEPEKVAIQTGQRKVKAGEEEHTLIEIYPI